MLNSISGSLKFLFPTFLKYYLLFSSSISGIPVQAKLFSMRDRVSDIVISTILIIFIY